MRATPDLTINDVTDIAAQALPRLLTMPRRQRKRIVRLMRPVMIDAHRQFIREGTAGRELFLIGKGSATVMKQRAQVATVEPGDVVGELAVLTGEQRAADVVAQEDIVGVALNRMQFAAVSDLWPAFHRLASSAALSRF